MEFATVDEYLSKLHFADPYESLDLASKESIVFEAEELLKDHFKESRLTDRAIALQVLFMLEGEGEEYAKLKRHGVQSYSVKGVSITFNGSNISPDVLALLRTTRATVGRLI